MEVSRTNRLACVLAHRQRESAFYDVQERKKYTYSKRGLALGKYANREDVFGSFTDLPKLGINPSTTYNTPIGVYSYPIDYLMNLYDRSTTEFEVPFAGKSRFLHIFSVKDLDRVLVFEPSDTVNLYEVKNSSAAFPITDSQGEAIYEILEKARRYVLNNTNEDLITGDGGVSYQWYQNFIEGLKSPEGAGIGQLSHVIQKVILKHFTFDDVIYYNLYSSGDEGGIEGFRPVHVFNQIIKDMSLIQAIREITFPYEDRLRNLPDVKVLSDEDYQIHKMNAVEEGQRVECDTAFAWKFLGIFTNNKVRWTALLRQMGFIGAIDKGTGTIHENEPTQAVFFNPPSIKVIEVMHNEVPKQWQGYNTGTQSLLGQWAENPGERIESAFVFLDSEIDTLKQSRERAIIRGFNVKIGNDIHVGLANILKYIGWLNMSLSNHPKWSPARRKQVELEIERSIYGPVLEFKQVKDLYERIIKSLRVRNR